MKLTADPFL